VADYFAMLADDIAGRPYGKAEHNRQLQAIIDRPRGSIEVVQGDVRCCLEDPETSDFETSGQVTVKAPAQSRPRPAAFHALWPDALSPGG
jgi:hypothetical protein